MIAQQPTTKEGWLNRTHEKIQRNPGIKIKDLARSLNLSQSYTREILKALQDLQLVRLEKERHSKAILLFTPDYQPAPPPPVRKAQDTCKYYRVDPSDIWRYRGGHPLPDSARITSARA